MMLSLLNLTQHYLRSALKLRHQSTQYQLILLAVQPVHLQAEKRKLERDLRNFVESVHSVPSATLGPGEMVNNGPVIGTCPAEEDQVHIGNCGDSGAEDSVYLLAGSG